MSTTPLSYLISAGARADRVLPLTWFTLIVSIMVCVVIAVLLWLAVRRAARSGGPEQTRAVALQNAPENTRWISIGLMISAVPLLVTLVWTMVALADVSGPPADPALTVDVFAHQWWWEVHYPAEIADQAIETANEIHIPVGVKVLLRLHGSDVIHSFWVPQLSGKTDMIPGQVNTSWLEARAPGRYRGQCGEYCGLEHAHMALEVVAQSQADFDRWRGEQLRPAPAPQTPEQSRGLALVEYRCGTCHDVRGTGAGAHVGPDLTHLMSRQMIAAGELPNTPGELAGWIENPQGLKPGALMPNQYLSVEELADVQSYLATLR